MKFEIQKQNLFVIAWVIVCLVAMMTSAPRTWAQLQWDNQLLPPLEQFEGEQNKNGPDDSRGETLSSFEALTVPNEEEALDRFSKGASDFEKMFQPLLAEARQSLVKIRSKGASRSRRAKKRQIALGTIVSKQGWVLTKASELKGQLFCEISNGELVEAEIYGLDPEYDLALLKMVGENASRQWEPANWAGPVAAITGDWVATPLDHQQDSHLGVVSVDSRLIPPSKPFIGIFMSDAQPAGILISGIQPKSPASQSGLKVDDVIMKLDEAVVKDIAQLREQLEQHDAGDVITLTVVRAQEQRRIKLTLANRDKVSFANMRSNQQNRMGTRLSTRRKNFPLAFQHDTVLQANECGGPIVNIDAKVVGVNVARAGRVASLAIPAHRIQQIVKELGTGAYSPEIVNARRIRAVDREIKDTQALSDQLANRIEDLLKNQSNSKQVLPGYEAAVDEMVTELAQLREKIESQKTEIDDSRKEILRTKRLIKDLNRERERLQTGVR